MAQSVPSDGDIETFMSFTGGASRDDAITFIRGASGNVDRAINDYFDDPRKYFNQNRYDESAWSQDRDGDYGNSDIPAFQIDYADNPHYPHSNAPTRPPSRVSQNSSTKGIPGSPLIGNDETWQGQESGIISGSGTQFGPANQDKYYDNSAWAMTWPGASAATEAFSDPYPAKRKRKPSQPAFLKPLGNGDYLPSLITILHSIPLGHYALGLDGETAGNYKFDPEWWHGNSSAVDRVISLDNDEEPIDHGREFLEETQKLIAFLDLTTRSYGSAAALSQSRVLEESAFGGQARTFCDRFLLAWETHALRAEPNLLPQMSLFKSQAVSVAPRSKPDLNPFCTLLLTLSNRSGGETSTLYDELDETIWNGDLDGKSAADQAISQHAPILCIRVEQPDFTASNLNFQVPMTWYADRYLHENAEKAKQMRRDTTQQRLSLQQIEQAKQQATSFTTEDGKKLDIQEMLKIARAVHSNVEPLVIDDDGEPVMDMDTVANKYDLLVPTPRPDVVEKLEAIARNVERKLERLDQQKEEIKAAIQSGRSLLKAPTDNPDQQQPTVRYNLCGFATDARTTYVLKRAKDQLIEMNEEEPQKDQWWKFHYPSGDEPNIEKQRIDEGDVTNLASLSSRDVLLVYAVDGALTESDLTWPGPLQDMIQQDNALFAAELTNVDAASASQPLAAADKDVPNLANWANPDDPPAYAAGNVQGFVADDGKLSDQAYADQGTREQAGNRRTSNHLAASTVTAVTEPNKGVHGSPSDSSSAGINEPTGERNDDAMAGMETEEEERTKVHLEYAGSGEG